MAVPPPGVDVPALCAAQRKARAALHLDHHDSMVHEEGPRLVVVEGVDEVVGADRSLAAMLAVLPVPPGPHLPLVAHRDAVVVAGRHVDDPDAIVAQGRKQHWHAPSGHPPAQPQLAERAVAPHVHAAAVAAAPIGRRRRGQNGGALLLLLPLSLSLLLVFGRSVERVRGPRVGGAREVVGLPARDLADKHSFQGRY